MKSIVNQRLDPVILKQLTKRTSRRITQTQRFTVLLEEIKGEFRSVSDGHKAMVKKFGKMETNVYHRLDEVETKLDVVKAELIGRMDGLEKSMDGLEKSVETTLIQQSKNIMEALGETNQKVDGHGARILALEAR